MQKYGRFKIALNNAKRADIYLWLFVTPENLLMNLRKDSYVCSCRIMLGMNYQRGNCVITYGVKS